MRITAKLKRERQAQGIEYGCHMDLAPGEEPDECVIDYADRGSCIHGYKHRTREGCPYWQPKYFP